MNLTFCELFNRVNEKLQTLGLIPSGVLCIPHDEIKEKFEYVDDCTGRIVRYTNQIYLEILVHGRLVDDICYEFKDGKNILRLKKDLK